MLVEACHDARHRCFLCRGVRPELLVRYGHRPLAVHRNCAAMLLQHTEVRAGPSQMLIPGVRVQNSVTGDTGTVVAQNGSVVHVSWDG